MRPIDKINRYSHRTLLLSEEKVYIFSVILCDNEIDRDCEKFSDGALEKLSSLYIGKTSVFDCVPAVPNQTARIFDTELITDNSHITKNGEPYKYLKASAYLVRTEENKNLITEIESGIKKEVSISCSAVKRICSICGCNKNKENCPHEKGKNYGEKQCYIILDDITDAYEWSFVSVPIQVNAICDHPVEAEPVRYGEWVYGEYDIPHCSECGKGPKEISPFCPQCGAKMEDKDE